MKSPLSLVAGGTGLVGSHVVKVLSKKPGAQIILARSFDSEIPQNADLQVINFDYLGLSFETVRLQSYLLFLLSRYCLNLLISLGDIL